MLPVEIPMGDGTVFFFDAGAVILIILAIIFVPRLLGGSKKKDTTAPKPKPAPKPAPSPKPAPKSAPAPKPRPVAKPMSAPRPQAEDEVSMVLNSPMTQYVSNAFINALQELRPQLAASATHKDYFQITVYKDSCRLSYNAYELRENRYKSTQMITEVSFKTIQNIFCWENSYEQISSRKAKAELKEFLVHECINKTGFLIRVQGDWLGLLISQM